MFFLTGTVLALGGFTTQSVGEGTFLDTSTEFGSILVGQTEVIVQACIFAVFVVVGAVGRVT